MMDQATLRQRHRAAVGRYYRAIVDGDGDIPAGLLTELADIADEHAQPDDLPSRVPAQRTRGRNRADGTEAA